MQVDSLIEVSAFLFRAGDKSSSKDLDDYLAWEKPWDEASKEIENPVHGIDTEFTEDVFAFEVEWISEGRTDYNYCCGLQYEIDNDGFSWFSGSIEYFSEQARKIKAEYETPKLRPFRVYETPPKLPVTSFRWIEAIEYWSRHDSYTGETDCGMDFLGRVTLSEISNLIYERNKEPNK